MEQHDSTPQAQPDPGIFQRTILFALNRSGQHIYGGTVSSKVKAHRRAASKAARKSRRVNRGR